MHPELCQQLVPLFDDAKVGPAGRNMIVDLLASVGHAQAQQALRDILQGKAAREDRAFPLLYQRLSLVQNPDPQTMKFVSTQYQSTQGPAHHAAMYSLGSAAGHRYRAGDHEGGLAAARQLERDLAAARDPAEREYLLESLGNAGLAEQAATIQSYASSTDANVRLAAANALRKMQGVQVQQTLMGMVSDADPMVAEQAMLSLAKTELTQEMLSSLAALVAARSIGERSYEVLVTLLQPYQGRSPTVTEIFQSILSQDLRDPTVKVRIRNMLGL